MPKIASLSWYFHRLRAMSIREIGYRLQQQAIAEWERFRKPAGGIRPWFLSGWEEFHAEKRTCFFFQWNQRSDILEQHGREFPQNRLATLQIASELVEHTFQIFGRKVSFGPRIPWQADPLSGHKWPARHWVDIDVRKSEVGGVKWVWELNRHHHLVTLGKAYFLSGDERFAEEVCAQLEDWILTNPPYIGVNWTSALELAVRLINWTFALAFIRGFPGLKKDLFGLIMQSIALQADYILRHLSAYSSANNHLIGEAAGLAIVGLSFPWLPRADTWRDKGLAILKRELEKQICPDGVPREQSTHYLMFVLDFNSLAWRLAELNGFPVPSVWYERLSAACDFIRHLMDGRGNVPAIGDSDDGWVIRLDDRAKVNNFQSVLAIASVLLHRPDFKVSAKEWDEKSHWLLGEEGKRVFETLPDVHGMIASRAFKEGGYCVMRDSDRVIVFDCGPLGYLATAAHGHADALSVLVSVEGQPLLIDPGTYAYHEGGGKRDYFRSTLAHNTVVVDGENQSEILGTFLWGRKAETRLLRWESTAEYDLAIAEHNGYGRLGVIHRRIVFYYKPDWLVVKDDLLGKNEHGFEQIWHLLPGFWPDINPGYGAVLLRTDEIFFLLFLLESPPCTCIQVHFAETEPMQGWFSGRYGHIEPAPALSISAQSTLPAQLVTVLYLRAIPGALLDVEKHLAHLMAQATELVKFLAGGL